MFEEELMPHQVKPFINETILNLKIAIQCDTDEHMLASSPCFIYSR